MAMTEPIGDPIITPTAMASRSATAAVITMYSPDRSGMARPLEALLERAAGCPSGQRCRRCAP